jgi:UDP-glucose 4-epimerase
MAAQLFCWNPDLKMIGLRFSNVMEPADCTRFPPFDARDGAQAVRLALELDLTGIEIFIIANADTVMSRPNAELSKEFYPDVEVRGDLGEPDTLLSIEKA